MVRCKRCYLELLPAEINEIHYSKNEDDDGNIILCPSCMRFISDIITAAVDDIIEEYILREE